MKALTKERKGKVCSKQKSEKDQMHGNLVKISPGKPNRRLKGDVYKSEFIFAL